MLTGHFTEDGHTLQEALTIADPDQLREKFTYWNKRAKETQGAVAVLTELKVKQKNVSAANPRIDDDIKTLRGKLAELQEKKGKVTAERDAAERSAGRRKMLQKELDRDRIDFDKMIKEDKAAIRALVSTRVAEPNPERIAQARALVAGSVAKDSRPGRDNPDRAGSVEQHRGAD